MTASDEALFVTFAAAVTGVGARRVEVSVIDELRLSPRMEAFRSFRGLFAFLGEPHDAARAGFWATCS